MVVRAMTRSIELESRNGNFAPRPELAGKTMYGRCDRKRTRNVNFPHLLNGRQSLSLMNPRTFLIPLALVLPLGCATTKGPMRRQESPQCLPPPYAQPERRSNDAGNLPQPQPPRTDATTPTRLTAHQPIFREAPPMSLPVAPEEVKRPSSSESDDTSEALPLPQGEKQDKRLDCWWEEPLARQLRELARPVPIDVETLVVAALRHSSQVRAISDDYLIRRTSITEAAAAFDVRSFMDTRYIRTNEPVGNTLTTGGPPRFLDDNFRASAGLRKKASTGGTWELSQRIGLQDSNSVFFLPTNQGNARLSLSFSQPLLNGAGRAYNSSITVLAEIDAQIAEAQTSQALQEHLLSVTRAYWELCLQRAVLVQRQRLHFRAQQIQEELNSRQDVDALQSQLVRARAAVSSRRAELIRAEAAIKNAEARIRALVNAPEMLSDVRLELIPTERPAQGHFAIEESDARATALQNRPEINQALKQIQAANVRLNISKNEIRPNLDLVLEGYLSGLQGNHDIGQAFTDQFTLGAPSYTAGLVYEYAWNNRAAQARLERRQLEVRRLTAQFDASLQQLSAEVEVAVREVQTSYDEMRSKHQAMMALETEMEYLTQRWQLLPGDDRSASFLLGDLLDVQERVAREEFEFARAQINYTLALAELKRATGTLLQFERITPLEIEEDRLPRRVFDKPDMAKP